MRIIVYTPVQAARLRAALGEAEYSYQFVLRFFRPVLERLGEVITVTDPDTEADPLYAQSLARGEPCVLLVFAPPHRAPVGLACPTVTVVAWEFDTIPQEAWGGEPRNDWAAVFRGHGRVIVLSHHTAAVVRAALGANGAVAAIPTPIYDRIAPHTPANRPLPAGRRAVRVDGNLIDNRDYEFTEQAIRLRPGAADLQRPPWDGRPRELRFTMDSEDCGGLIGFYAPEAWGTWSRIEQPWLLLPFTVSGPVRLHLVGRGYLANVGRPIRITVGDASATITLTDERGEYTVDLDVTAPASVVQFSGLTTEVAVDALEVRTLGIGLATMSITRPPRRGHALRAWARRRRPTPAPPARQRRTLELDGVVFTSVFNPYDGRKNWESLITAFCHSFRETPDATLVLKMTHHSLTSFYTTLQYQLHRVGPVACRVVAVHGYLPDEEYLRLMDVTTFYANASRGEGMCMPLMEYLSAGVPAISPDHTAMADYLTPANAFVVASSPVAAEWPHDERGKIRTRYSRVDWQSLADAFTGAYRVATTDPDRYLAMSRAARASMARFCADDIVRDRLAEFLAVPS